MSNYHQSQYGGNYHGHNNAPYPPQYPNQYLQAENGHPASVQGNANYDAYGYNGAMPGFNPAAVPSVSPIPIFQGWNQDSIPLPPYTAPPNPSAFPGYNNTPQYYPPFNQTGYQPPLPVAAAPKPSEQGELSEGEFDEGSIATNTTTVGHGTSKHHGNDGVSYGGNSQRKPYSQSQGYSARHSPLPVNNLNSPAAQEVPALARRGSDSYSPYISPRELNIDQSTSHHQGQMVQSQNGESSSGSVKQENGRVQIDSAGNSHNQNVTNGNTPKAVQDYVLVSNVQSPLRNPNSAANVRTLAEAKKAAQSAVLDLWPYVQYQAYINEGYMESSINRLFEDANIPRNTANPVHGRSPTRKQRTPIRNFSMLQNEPPSNLNGNSGPYRVGGAEGAVVNGNNKAPLSVSTNLPTPAQNQIATGSETTTSLPVTPIALSDKERTIQAKMDALRKSREERAQKAAAQKTGKPVVTTQAPYPASLPEKPKHLQLASAPASPTSPKEAPLNLQPTPVQPQAPGLAVQPTLTSDSLPTTSQPLPHPTPTPNIPGLFLTSNASSPAPPTAAPSTMFASAQNNLRKRPVAADFDDPIPTATPAKRPFGHSREESLVIDVSEDEESDDEDVAMDIDSEANQDSPVQPARRMSDQRFSAIQNLPPLSNFPKPWMNSSTPPTVNTPPVASRPAPEELQRKESEIEELKRRIAQAEARNKARQTPSGTRTPVPTQTNALENPNVSNNTTPLPTTAPVSEASKSISVPTEESRVVATEQSVTLDLSNVQTKIVEDKSVEDDEMLREEELARNEVSLRAHEFAQQQKKLEEMKAEFARIETAAQEAAARLQQAKEKDLRLQEEKELRMQKQKQMAEETLRIAASVPLPRVIASTEVEIAIRSPSIAIASLPKRPSTAHSDRSIQASISQEEKSIARSISPVVVEQAALPVSEEVDQDVDAVVPEATALAPITEAADHNISNAHALEAALQEAVRAEADAHSADEGEVDIEMSNAPDPIELAPESLAVEERGSPEYSPIQHRNTNLDPAEEDEEDDYEPPEATPPADSPPFSPAPPIETDTPPLDDVMQDVVPSISDNSGLELIDESDDQSALPVLNGSAPVPEVPKEESSIRYFTPYKSPLRQFRAYRFHPQFKSEVTGGLRSLTYSNEINPNAELCRYELAGGICNDVTCYCLHFKDIGLKDSMILAALGSPGQFKGPRMEEFKEGLTRVLLKLRVDKIRDFHIIAAEILAYRAKFLGDASKILPLEDVTI